MTNFILALLYFSFNFAYAIPAIWEVPSGTTKEIRAFNVCKSVTNNIIPSETLMVDTYTSPKWSTFYGSPPAGVTIGNCASIAAPIFLNSTSIFTSGSTNCTVSKPAGLKEGDLMITVLYDSGSLTSLTPPSGFTEFTGLANGPVCGSYYGKKHYKLATAADASASNFTFTRTGNFSDCGLMMMAFTNVNQTTPIAANVFNSGNGTTITYSSSNATTASSLSLGIGESCAGTPNTPSGYSKLIEYGTVWTIFSGKILTSIGSTGSFTSSVSNGAWLSAHIIINPN